MNDKRYDSTLSANEHYLRGYRDALKTVNGGYDQGRMIGYAEGFKDGVAMGKLDGQEAGFRAGYHKALKITELPRGE